MKHFVPILAVIIFIFSCTSNSIKSKNPNINIDSFVIPADSNTKYFLQKINWEDTSVNMLDDFKNAWYSKMLFSLKEPVLFNYSGYAEIYRFTWLRTFHHPVCLRMQKLIDSINLFAKVTNGAGGYDPGNFIINSSKLLSEKEWDELLGIVREINFWKSPTEIDDSGKDGSEWIIEAYKNGNYHMITRWSPTNERNGNFRDLGEYLIKLAEIKSETEFSY